MKKLIYCNECAQVGYVFRSQTVICDTCGEKLSIGIPVELSFGYGSSLDGNNYDFCSHKCLADFINAEIQKETK